MNKMDTFQLCPDFHPTHGFHHGFGLSDGCRVTTNTAGSLLGKTHSKEKNDAGSDAYYSFLDDGLAQNDKFSDLYIGRIPVDFDSVPMWPARPSRDKYAII
ncbi:MAG: hypothetical protein IH969_04150 [Candidatus Krumholzibacteriota bacterium]|nr:hypothetical protein [Candidatus Krumholzibacteriota bacterium]